MYISTSKLQKEIDVMSDVRDDRCTSRQMPKELALHMDNIATGLQNIHKLLRTKISVTQNYIFFEITFP